MRKKWQPHDIAKKGIHTYHHLTNMQLGAQVLGSVIENISIKYVLSYDMQYGLLAQISLHREVKIPQF